MELPDNRMHLTRSGEKQMWLDFFLPSNNWVLRNRFFYTILNDDDECSFSFLGVKEDLKFFF